MTYQVCVLFLIFVKKCDNWILIFKTHRNYSEMVFNFLVFKNARIYPPPHRQYCRCVIYRKLNPHIMRTNMSVMIENCSYCQVLYLIINILTTSQARNDLFNVPLTIFFGSSSITFGPLFNLSNFFSFPNNWENAIFFWIRKELVICSFWTLFWWNI